MRVEGKSARRIFGKEKSKEEAVLSVDVAVMPEALAAIL